jgi:hypothetical protein
MTADPGTITQAGTQVTAARMNNIEDGIKALYDELIYNGTLGGDTAQIDITISGYTMYKLYVIGGTSDGSKADLWLRFNDDTGGNYTMSRTSDDGATTGGTTETKIEIGTLTTGNIRGFTECNIYQAASDYPVVYAHWTETTSNKYHVLSHRNNTEAITKINLLASSGSIKTGTIIKLWGLR